MKLMSSLDASSSSNTTSNSQQTALVYECPICNLGGLLHHQLLDHSKQHANVPGMCPICAVKDDREYYSKHLYGHLMLRHNENKDAAAGSNTNTVKGKHQTAADPTGPTHSHSR